MSIIGDFFGQFLSLDGAPLALSIKLDRRRRRRGEITAACRSSGSAIPGLEGGFVMGWLTPSEAQLRWLPREGVGYVLPATRRVESTWSVVGLKRADKPVSDADKRRLETPLIESGVLVNIEADDGVIEACVRPRDMSWLAERLQPATK